MEQAQTWHYASKNFLRLKFCIHSYVPLFDCDIRTSSHDYSIYNI